MNHRLKEHDYVGRGFYFITATTHPRPSESDSGKIASRYLPQ